MPGPATAARISRWGIVVMASALLVGGAVAALAIASVTSSHERQVSFAVRGSLSGVALDLGDGDIVDRRRRAAGRARGPAHRALRVRPRRRGPAHAWPAASCASTRAAPTRCSRRARSATAWSCPTTSRSTSARRGGNVTLPRLPRLGAGDDARRRRSTSPATAATRSTRARRAATSPSSAACAPPAARRCARRGLGARVACRRAATTSTPRARRAATTCAASTRRADAPFAIQVLSSSGDVVGGGRVRDRGARARPPPRARRPRRRLPRRHAAGRRCWRCPRSLALVLGAALSVVGIGLPLLLAAAAACRAARAARPARRQPLAGRAGPADPGRACATAGQRVPALARPALRPRAVADGAHAGAPAAADRGAVRRRARAGVRCSRVLLQLGVGGRRRARRRSTTSGRGRSGRAWASCCWRWRRPRRCSSWPRSRRSTACCARSAARCWRRARRRAGRCARCWPRASATARCRSPTGCPTASASSTRPASPSRCPSPARGARGPRSSATAGASRRSSTTPRWTPAPSSSRPPPRRPRWRSTTSA